MIVAIAILTTLAAGLPLTLAIQRDARGPALLGLSFLYGSALVWAAETALSAAGVRWTLGAVNAVVLLVSGVCLYVAGLPGRRDAPRSAPTRPHPIDILTLGLLCGQVLYATIAPLWEWDFWAIWGLKARVFLSAGRIDWRFLESRWNDFAHPDYPLLLPLNYVYASLFAGWSDRWLGLYTVAFGVALLLVIRQLVAAETTSTVAATVTLAAAAFAFSDSIGLAEAPVIAFGTAGLLYLRRALASDDPDAARHGALLLGCAALAKDEGLSLLVAAAIALVFAGRRLLPKLWPAAAVYAPWMFAKATHALPTYLTQGSMLSRVEERLLHPGAFLAPFAVELPDVLMWVLMIVAFMVIAPSRIWRERFVLLAVTLQLVFILGAYLVTPYDVAWQVATSWPRLARQLAAPLVCVVMIMLAETAAPEDDQAHAEARPDV